MLLKLCNKALLGIKIFSSLGESNSRTTEQLKRNVFHGQGLNILGMLLQCMFVNIIIWYSKRSS